MISSLNINVHAVDILIATDYYVRWLNLSIRVKPKEGLRPLPIRTKSMIWNPNRASRTNTRRKTRGGTFLYMCYLKSSEVQVDANGCEQGTVADDQPVLIDLQVDSEFPDLHADTRPNLITHRDKIFVE
jgi:hypothetical protein